MQQEIEVQAIIENLLKVKATGQEDSRGNLKNQNKKSKN